MTLRIRPAGAADLPGIAEVGARTWPATYLSFAGREYVERNLAAYWSPAALERALAEALLLLVAEDDGEVVGVVEVGEHDGVPTMWRLYVLPDRHGGGVGRALLDAAVAALPAGTAALLTEYTAGNDRAARWYAARGFVETGRDPGAGGLDVVWLRLSLPR
ncbi:GNAT family N-acetyltransferase [Modestobacter sp. VKM Ac-2986]|uniref:GNAT family N-acetyltransferase n=1 Tax=Modestobacter sp. VKM Ac-2986 TaxID=3004140 RepID=UPI0022ABC322|nr:GNAT family N-acetyltransferase [Modestobacter sp. VKM Ac-2986]MCZ2830200.1 GNAT family N-acetyltransferase [Modestobacter sp. VKM Ac-2986]